MPWVYTHKYEINSYTSDYQSIGHWAGPNSQIIYAHLHKRWTRRLNSGLIFRQWKHGANYENENIGGDILVGHGTLLGDQTEARQTRTFLEGIREREDLLRFYMDYELFNGFYLNGKYTITNILKDETENRYNEFYLGFRLFY